MSPVLMLVRGLLIVVVLVASCVPVARMTSVRPARRRAAAGRQLVVSPGALPPPVASGLGLAVNGGRGGHGLPFGTAIATVALAAATLVAGIGLTSSLASLIGSPQEFGAPWTFSFGGLSAEASDAEAFLRRADGVAAAAGIIGADAEIGGRVYWVQSFAPVPGVDEVIGPVIIQGREPVRDDEIALGAITMRQLGVEIGDRIEARGTVTNATPVALTVVGTALINDTYEGSPGLGAIVTPEVITTAAPEASSPDPYVVRLTSDADPAAFRTALEEAFPSTISGPVRQQAIRNVERIAHVPYMLAVLVGLLAVASLAHALVLATRRQRGQLAVLRTLGFTRGQVVAALGSQASVVALFAALIGLPLGVIAGRWGWRAIADQLGVASGPVVPLVAVGGVVVALVVLANVVVAWPAWRAARVAPAEALRVE